jgi:SAM-dependent methyltransferase
MLLSSSRQPVACALCGAGSPNRVRYPERIMDGPIDFAARKAPTRQHFRVVECLRCGLVYSDPILPHEVIGQYYRDSRFIRETQLHNMLQDYQQQLRQALPLLPRRERLLEIGCGDGFFLRAALDLGFSDVWGVEPGQDAVRQAEPSIRSRIVNAPFGANLFAAGSFDIICAFQVLDHLLDPNTVLRGAHRLLRPGGLLLLLNHNIRSWLPRLLGERCPMYDVEHIYLFDPRTVSMLLRNNGFDVETTGNVPNSYTVEYALKMFPLPHRLKMFLLTLAERSRAGTWRVRLPGGNMVTLGRKTALLPEASAPSRAPFPRDRQAALALAIADGRG